MNEDLQRLWIRLTTDRRRFGAMCTLAAVGLLLWARLLLLQDVPRTGLAEPAEQAAAALPDAATTHEQAPRRPSIESAPLVYLDSPKSPARNIFAAPQALLSQPEQAAGSDEVAPKSQSETPEDSPETRRQQIEREAQGLRLGSLILGAAPAAVINDRVVREGGTISGFVLERVLKRSVILVKDQVRVELKMDTPG